MIEEVAPELFRVEVPLPKNPLKSINSYVIRGADRNLVIDTGMLRDECEQALQAGFRELDLDLNRTDFFITHFHADHLGLVANFASQTSAVYFNEPEAILMSAVKDAGGFWKRVAAFARTGGIPEQAIQEAIKEHPGAKYTPPAYPEFTIVEEGSAVNVGGYNFECVSTPGHTPGHMCLYDRGKKIFISGDHVLGDITPNISAWVEDVNPLDDYLASLDKVAELDVVLVLPGHRNVFKDLKGRVEELKRHHQERVEEVFAILGPEGKTVYDVASRMSWDIDADSWEDFPIMQKWFATGEAATHLRYLHNRDRIRVDMEDGAAMFSK